ncbi:unnamed protein product [Darwinula stevensoni]|uniref:Uncharacterized protein n=1 Tax=Darwinula stevensoni TaxID=69355 RepID=A0A7R8X816_9CRUS|nr:unnamed protein product [Darwinula stevensoni]CAG0888334.1 unnamed protein product [Darwinula stevensoni]
MKFVGFLMLAGVFGHGSALLCHVCGEHFRIDCRDPSGWTTWDSSHYEQPQRGTWYCMSEWYHTELQAAAGVIWFREECFTSKDMPVPEGLRRCTCQSDYCNGVQGPDIDRSSVSSMPSLSPLPLFVLLSNFFCRIFSL